MPDNDYDWMMLNMGLFQFHSRGTDLAGEIIRPVQLGSQTFGTADEWEAAAGVAEKAGRVAEASELTAKYSSTLMKANELNKVFIGGNELTTIGLDAGEKTLAKIGIAAGVISVGIDTYRYTHGQISGIELSANTTITGITIGASIFMGPEAGLFIEGLAEGAKAMTKAEDNDPRARDFVNQMAIGPWMN
jgi:hypothetical protein